MSELSSMITVTGIEETLEKLSQEIKKIQGRTLKGLIHAATYIDRQSMKNAPRLTGNLAASHAIILYTGPLKPTPRFKGEAAEKIGASYSLMSAESLSDVQTDKLEGQDSVIVGVGAYYAIFVHEKHASRPKFLERAIKEGQTIILEYIRKEARFA